MQQVRRPLRPPVQVATQKPKQPTITPGETHAISYHRRMHYFFMAIYALMSALFIIGCAIWINYRSIFQSGLIGFFHIATGILIGVYIPSNVTDEWRTGEQPVSRTERDEHRKRREYVVFKKSASSLIVVAVIGVLLSSIYLYNLIYILAGICPTLASDDTTVNPTVITLELAYRHKPNGEYYSKRNVLVLKYNTTSQSIIRKTRTSNPNIANYDRWFTQNEVHTLSGINSDARHAPAPPLCINRTDVMLFSFLENEISHFMFKSLDERLDAKSIRVNDKYHVGASNDEEEGMDLHLLTTKICRHEQPFVWAIIIFLFLWDLMSIGLIAYCVYLIRS